MNAVVKHLLKDWRVRGAGVACTYCGRDMIPYSDTHPTRDHVIPKCHGGWKTVWACGTCNQIKADMMPDDWQEFMINNPRWWVGRETIAYVKPCPLMVEIAEFFYLQRYYKTLGVSRVIDVSRNQRIR